MIGDNRLQADDCCHHSPLPRHTLHTLHTPHTILSILSMSLHHLPVRPSPRILVSPQSAAGFLPLHSLLTLNISHITWHSTSQNTQLFRKLWKCLFQLFFWINKKALLSVEGRGDNPELYNSSLTGKERNILKIAGERENLICFFIRFPFLYHSNTIPINSVHKQMRSGEWRVCLFSVCK